MFVVWKVATHPVLGHGVQSLNHPSCQPYAAVLEAAPPADDIAVTTHTGRLLAEVVRIQARPNFDDVAHLVADALFEAQMRVAALDASLSDDSQEVLFE